MPAYTCTSIHRLKGLYTTDEALQEVFADESAQEAVMTCGITNPSLTTGDKPKLLKLLCLRDVF